MPSLKITHNAANTANANNAPAGNNGQNVNHTKQAIDDARIIALKEQGNLTWADIAARFPGRTKGSIQVRYCRTLHKA
ncbi:putative myb dna-binding domain-containing protein [Neofusicoccum parvum UCRNP2]|uniref:Putative myb dna-binding domain-containing protein n=1 Tax=Botryosphaeria parva (strain UCR-NP2) TaxID=1287680 RepID=R1GT77_BOTPV|nr:putative myb dna-binding domain-containing protein [Neofusicoccum parvum UCRNP2]